LTLLSGSLDGTAAVWDVVTGRCVRRFDPKSPVKAVFFIPGSQAILTWTTDEIVRRWDPRGNLVSQMEGIRLPISVSKDGRTLTAISKDSRALRIDLDGAERRLSGSVIPADEFVCFSENCKYVYTLRDGTRIQRWDTATGRNEGAFRDLGIQVTALRPTPSDDKVIGVMETGELTVYMVGSGINVSTLRGHAAAVRAVANGPGDNLWVTGSDDCSVRVWHLAQETCLTVLEGHSAPVRVVLVFPNASMLASGGRDGSVRLWGLEWDL